MSLKRKCNSYDAAFKLRAVEMAEASNNSAAARELGVNEKQIREWRKQKSLLSEMPKTKRARRSGAPHHAEMEKDLNDWVLEKRQNGYIVSRTHIRLQALKLLKSGKYPRSSTGEQFSASAGWCTRFMDRYGLSLRQRTKLSQKLPRDLEAKIDSFVKFTLKLRRQHGYDLSQIGNMDETPMFFDLPGNRTVHPKGEATVLVKTTGHEKAHFTVVLACMADGTKLKPMVIFKRKTLPKNLQTYGLVSIPDFI